MTRDKIQEFTLKISKANKTEMIAILYDMGIQYLEDAKKALQTDNNKELFRTEISRARNVISELMASVNPSMDLGFNFISLYIYSSKELTRAFLDYQVEPIDHVISVFSKLSEAYGEVAKTDMSGAVMGNSQKVYSGLTYNRALLNNLAMDISGSRGFLA